MMPTSAIAVNKILTLFDQAYVLDLFNKNLLPLYPDFKQIKHIEIIPIKKHVWRTTYHVVIKFITKCLAQDGRLVELPIYCTAHSNEPRKSSFAALSFLWQADFNQGHLLVPHPLFFSDDFNGFFYRGFQGHTLYYYLNKKEYKIIEQAAQGAAAWLAKLHNTPITEDQNFNPLNSRVATVIPGLNNILQKINQAYPRYFKVCKKIYEIIIREENNYFLSSEKKYLIHGDAHARNVIKISRDKISFIDFTDICLADFTRDVGTFMQQLDVMAAETIDDSTFIAKIKNIFFKNYLTNSQFEIDDYAKKRINNYYNWTALRTATFFMLKDEPEPARAHNLLMKICENFGIKNNL